MKYWLLSAALICMGSLAYAGQDVDILFSSCTTQVVSVSSSVATQVLTAALTGTTTTFPNVLSNRLNMELQNLSTSSTTYLLCGIDLSSTSATGDLTLTAPSWITTSFGRMIPPQGGVWNLKIQPKNSSDRVFVPWCINNGASASSKLAVTQCR